MKNVIELDQDEIINAITAALEARGTSADVGTIKFAFDGKGKLLAILAVERVEPEDFDDDKETPVPKISAAELLDQIQERFGDREMAVAICQRDSLDFVSEETLVTNTQAVWFEDYGVTITPLEEWPEEIIKKFESKKKPTEASTASDILGGGGDDPVDRTSALSKAMTGRKGG